ncbi:MAG TPA: cell division protein FtsQ/DivIB [Allosphingosinicella sp.]|nr:cell division protein FtsQ/DivIB [Allosphingosinicella sp.]
MSARIARGPAPRTRQTARAPARGKQTARRGVQQQALPDAVRRLSWTVLMVMLLALAIALLAAFRVPQMVGVSMSEAIGKAGFAVKRVEIKGLDRMERLPVYNVALDQQSMAMPLVDLDGTRRRLLEFGWVREARVSRRLPDTLVVDIVERRPAAIWQYRSQLALIDVDGVVLEPVRLDAMPDLPLVIGPAANHHAAELGRLIDAAPQLKPIMAGASWVGGRRWDVRFQSGEVLALPEGEEAAKKALTHFARMDQATQLLGRGFSRFDMRIAGKFVVRVSNKPGTEIPAMVPPPPPPAAGKLPDDVDPRTTI